MDIEFNKNDDVELKHFDQNLLIMAQEKGSLDDQQLSAELAVDIQAQARCWSLGRASVAEIEDLNSLHASMLAMHRAVSGRAHLLR